STTQGSFASIAGHDAGRAFLSRATTDYDAVLGYDHKTLSLGVLDNARGLAGELGALELPPNTEIDVVCYSRGGLVYRAFEEGGFAGALGLRLGNVAFVGCMLGGTRLA